MATYFYPMQSIAPQSYAWSGHAPQYTLQPPVLLTSSSIFPELPTVNSVASTVPSSIMAGNPVIQVLDDVSLKAAVEINRREAMDPEQVEMPFMESVPQLQSSGLAW